MFRQTLRDTNRPQADDARVEVLYECLPYLGGMRVIIAGRVYETFDFPTSFNRAFKTYDSETPASNDAIFRQLSSINYEPWQDQTIPAGTEDIQAIFDELGERSFISNSILAFPNKRLSTDDPTRIVTPKDAGFYGCQFASDIDAGNMSRNLYWDCDFSKRTIQCRLQDTDFISCNLQEARFDVDSPYGVRFFECLCRGLIINGGRPVYRNSFFDPYWTENDRIITPWPFLEFSNGETTVRFWRRAEDFGVNIDMCSFDSAIEAKKAAQEWKMLDFFIYALNAANERCDTEGFGKVSIGD